MFEDIKQHVFCYQKVLKLVIQIFVNANNQPEINGNLYILNLGSSSMFSECHAALKLTLHSSSGLSSLNI